MEQVRPGPLGGSAAFPADSSVPEGGSPPEPPGPLGGSAAFPADSGVPEGGSPPEPPGSSGRVVTVAFGALLTLGLIVAAVVMRDTPVSASHYVLLSLLLFSVGAVGVLVRRNALVLFMCIELMLNAVNLAFVTFARMHGRAEGQAAVLFVMIVAAAEVAVGLAIIVSIFRRRLSASVDEASLLRW